MNIYQESCRFWAENPRKAQKLEVPGTQKARLHVKWKPKALMSLKRGQYAHPSTSTKGTPLTPGREPSVHPLDKAKETAWQEPPG